MPKILFSVSFALLLAACASSSGVFRVEDNIYQVSTRATWEFGGRAGAREMALKEATKHCKGQGKNLRVIKSSENYSHFEGGTVNLLFSCEDSETNAQMARIHSGTCVAVHPDGLILTANHVIKDAKGIMVHLANERIYEAAKVQTDSGNDLALIKIAEHDLAYVSLAPRQSTHLGQYVFTIGYPATSVLGTEPKFTEGSISALSGPKGLTNLLQISVPVQPGNSGGPLMNESGELIGIITSTASIAIFIKETGALPQNVNWAVKADYARSLFDLPSNLPPARNRDDAIERTRQAVCLVVAEK